MALFPLFIDLSKRRVLVVGAGSVAERKVNTLLAFKPHITVVAKEVKKEVFRKWAEEGKIELKLKSFEDHDLKEKDIVIVAADRVDLQERIFKLCKENKVPVNCVDKPEYCTFIFPSVIVKGELVIGITTSGKAPSASKKLRQSIEKIIPEGIESLINQIGNIRNNRNLDNKEKLKLIYEATEKIRLNNIK